MKKSAIRNKTGKDVTTVSLCKKTRRLSLLVTFCCLAAFIPLASCSGTAPDTARAYRVAATEYADGQYSYCPDPDQAPAYYLAGDGTLYELQNGDAVLLGKLQPCVLRKQNFDALFRFPAKDGEGIAALRKNSRRAFAIPSAAPGMAQTDTYLLTEQKDGTVYLGCGYAKSDAADAHLRFFYRLEPLAQQEIAALSAAYRLFS